jgi:hypothetical protein
MLVTRLLHANHQCYDSGRTKNGAPAVRAIHRRYARPLFVHQSFIEYANESIRHSLWARAFYQMQKAANKTHWVIIRALAYKWIRILFRCWQERTPYDELRYLKALQRSGSPLLPYLAQPTTLTS